MRPAEHGAQNSATEPNEPNRKMARTGERKIWQQPKQGFLYIIYLS